MKNRMHKNWLEYWKFCKLAHRLAEVVLVRIHPRPPKNPA
nr:MAG TPA: hypothetical protein [Caudoviricetes sp.]